MELYFKEKLSLNGKVEITDADGNVLYSGKRSFWTGKLIMKDGEITKEFTRSQDLTQEQIIEYMI